MMQHALKAFMKRPTTLVGILTAIMFQVIFSVIWMTGYNGVSDRIDKLQIAIVNEDEKMGQQIAGNLIQNLPFDMKRVDSIDEAKQQLDERELQMVVWIPADFSQKTAAADGTASIQYVINESNPALIKSIMSGAAVQITAEVNKQAVTGGIQTVLGNMKLPAEQAGAAAQGLSERVTSEIQSMNVIQGMNNQMVPMMLVLASYVGAMIMGMNFEQSSLALSTTVSRWRRFAARSILNVGAGVIVSLVGSSLLAAFGGQMAQGFLHIWLFQLLFVLTFMFVAQMFIYLFGMSGMLFNIILLSAQLVTSGAIVPRELLSDFYIKLGDILPATYAVEGTMNILFGGPAATADALSLGLIAIVAIAVSALAVAVKGQVSQRRQPSVAIASKNG